MASLHDCYSSGAQIPETGRFSPSPHLMKTRSSQRTEYTTSGIGLMIVPGILLDDSLVEQFTLD